MAREREATGEVLVGFEQASMQDLGLEQARQKLGWSLGPAGVGSC